MKASTVIISIIFLIYIPVFRQLYIALKEEKKGNDTKISFKRIKLFLKYSFYVLITITLSVAVLSHTNLLNYESPMKFDKIEQITFENFRGLEFFKKELYGNERFAYVVCTIDSKIDENSVTIETLFHPSRSFVYNKNAHSNELLTHEKYHIKITELYTRKAKKRISQLEEFNKNKILKIIDQIEKEEIKFQHQYDFDTFHSYVLSEQKRYEKQIDSLLNLLVKYKCPKIDFNEKN